MAKRVLVVAAVAVAAVLSVGPAHAIPFTGTPSPALSPLFGTLINFDDKATNTLVGVADYVAQGVTISQTESIAGAVFARYAGSQSLPNYIGTGFGGERGDGGSGWDGTIRFSFFVPASMVGIGVADGLGGPETIRIFNTSGGLLESFVVPTGANVYVGFDRLGTYDISYFEITGSFFAVDDLQFDAVPEPGSLLLLGSGLLGLSRLRRRR